MDVVITSVILLFALIFLGFLLEKERLSVRKVFLTFPI